MSNETHFFVLTLAFLLMLSLETRCQFLSIEELEEFYDLEEKLVTVFQSYIAEQKALLNLMEERYEEHKKASEMVTDTHNYINNPLNVYALLRRLVSEWPLTLALLNDPEEFIKEGDLPTVKEYKSAVQVIGRIQQVYNINITDLVTGSVFQNTENSSVFTAADYFSVAQYFYQSHQYQAAVNWFKESLKQVIEEGKLKANLQGGQTLPTSEQILEYLALASCFKGSKRESSSFFLQLFTSYPSFHPSQELVQDHILLMNESCHELARKQTKIQNMLIPNLTSVDDIRFTKRVESVCQGKLDELKKKSETPLLCHLIHYGKPHLRIQPFKLEVLHSEHAVFIFHNALHTGEIERLVNTVWPKIENSDSWPKAEWKGKVDDWLYKRVEELTFLPPIDTEDVVFSSYRVGGEYGVHHDTVGHKDYEDKIAAMMVFLKEPESGGNFIFPIINLSVTPRKGDAIMWFNILPDKVQDYMTVHGECPVLQGHKLSLFMLLGKPKQFEVHELENLSSWAEIYL